ncbi:unnamed protein product [Symbiodinium sp. CCMP2456]|nr:unnamed protein product [Symbiodinium sp. CCMP2456]
MQDRAIKAKAPVEEDWEKEPKKRGWPKGKAKSKPKATAKAKAKAKAVAKPGKAKAKAKGKANAVAKPAEDEPGESDPTAKAKAVAKPSEGEPGKSDPKAKARAKAKAKGKARQMPCGDEKPSKRCKTDPKEDQPTSVSFARRNPQKGDSLCLWTAIRDSFYEVVRPFVKYPSKYEECQMKDPFWKHCKPKLLELDKTDDYLQVAKQEAADFLKKLG